MILNDLFFICGNIEDITTVFIYESIDALVTNLATYRGAWVGVPFELKKREVKFFRVSENGVVSFIIK